MTESLDTSDGEALDPPLLRLPVREMSAEPAPPPVAAGYEAHPVGTGERIKRLELALRNAGTSLETIARLAGRKTYGAERLETYMTHFEQVRGYAASRASVAVAALTSATKETT